MTVTIVGRTYIFGHTPTVIFRLFTGDQKAVFMRVDGSNYCMEDRAVVIVNAAKFLKAWQASQGPAWLGSIYACIDPIMRRHFSIGPGRDKWLPHLKQQGWMSDYKFHRAVNGFAQGSENPVPLARSGVDRAGRAVGFINGITRTLWLLANGARSFPIECPTKQAPDLQRLAGEECTTWTTVHQLLADYTWAQYLAEQSEDLI